MPIAPPDLDLVDTYLRYEPETGDLRWKTTRGARARQGDFAGVLNNQGYVVVTLVGKKYLGHYLAWYLYHGEWPAGRLTLKSSRKPGLTPTQVIDARSDLRIENIDLASKHLASTPTAERQRHYARHRAHRARLMDEHRRTSGVSRYDNVRYDNATARWVVYSIPADYTESEVPVLGYHEQRDAEETAYEVRANLNALQDANGKDLPPPLLDPQTAASRAGFKGPTLGDVVNDMAYDPARGAIFWRNGSRRGFSATQPTTGKTLIIPYHGWKLPAHSVAWFIAHGEWPVRGELNPVDEDWHNIRLANLFFAPRGSMAYDPVSKPNLQPVDFIKDSEQ